MVFWICRCIPYRYRNGGDGEIGDELEVLIITSQKGQGMMFPKVCIKVYIFLEKNAWILSRKKDCNDYALTFILNYIIRVVGNLMNLLRKQLSESQLKKLELLAMLRLAYVYLYKWFLFLFSRSDFSEAVLGFVSNDFNLDLAASIGQMELSQQKQWHILWRVYVPFACKGTTWTMAREKCQTKNLGKLIN